MKRFDHLLAALCVVALPLPCMGVDNLQFSGILLAPPVCQVSDQGGRLEVRFKSNIAISRIDGERYRQAIPYQIECPGAGNTPVTWHMRLTLKGGLRPFRFQRPEDLGARPGNQSSARWHCPDSKRTQGN
ncbi:hypothetical protein AAHI06_11545 [Pseudomonas salmasensis]|uniref:hypothetical protein n=1 Tax=Pseudomonas salmasensis TaxID=2745514 RepID=UPI003219FE97